jgi:hypothetical protein
MIKIIGVILTVLTCVSANTICDFAPLQVGYHWNYKYTYSISYRSDLLVNDSFDVSCQIIDRIVSVDSTRYIFKNNKKGYSANEFSDSTFIDTIVENLHTGDIYAKKWSVLQGFNGQILPVCSKHCIDDTDSGLLSSNYQDSLRQYGYFNSIYAQNIGCISYYYNPLGVQGHYYKCVIQLTNYNGVSAIINHPTKRLNSTKISEPAKLLYKKGYYISKNDSKYVLNGRLSNTLLFKIKK